MRTVSVKICGEELELPVSWQAGEQLEKAGYDPLRTGLKMRRGDFVWSAMAVVTVLYVGARAAGSKLKREQVGQAVFDAGVNAYLGTASDYLAEFVEAEPEFPIPGGANGADTADGDDAGKGPLQ
jgi:hypothetical protein